jgi:Domain of unknown function (DUF4062)
VKRKPLDCPTSKHKSTLNKRYQVFISSTYQDLKEEREEVIQALLELDCIPSGMELFPAANDDQWTLIKKVIDDCDYYLVIVAGRYGSISPTGISYTEMEYRYALDQNKPIIAFLYGDPSQLPSIRCESSPDGRQKLTTFRELTQQKMVKFWTNPSDLGSVVSRSIIVLMRNSPAIGWVRADMLPDKDSTEEILHLRNRVAELEELLEASRTTAIPGTEELSQGDDPVELEYHAGTIFDTDKPLEKMRSTWIKVFADVAPVLINEASDDALMNAIEGHIASRKNPANLNEFKCRLSNNCYNSIVVQLRALGLIAKSERIQKRKTGDTKAYWSLTSYGDNVMTMLRAVRRTNSN